MSCSWRILTLPLLLLLLLLLVHQCSRSAAASQQQLEQHQQLVLLESPDLFSDADEDFDAEAKSQKNATVLLHELRELLVSELDKRSRKQFEDEADGGSSDLDAVYAASHRIGKAMDKDLKRKEKKRRKRKRKKEKKRAFILIRLWNKLRKKMPLRAALACVAAAALLLLLLFALCCYCCCCRSSESSRSKRPVLPQTVKYRDIDLDAKKPPFGRINYSLEYDLNKSSLIVTASNCQHLPRGLESLDPYVTVTLTDEKEPDKAPKSKTSKVVRNSSNPVFNFGCSFSVKQRSHLKFKVITFEIFDWDLGTRHSMIARKVIHLRMLGDNLDNILGRSVDFSKDLKQGLEMEMKGPGDICVSLYYAAKDKSLTVNIVECKAVFVGKSRDKPDLETLPNIFIEAAFKVEGQKKEQVKRTELIRGSRNPYFNQEFVFEVGTIEQLGASWLRLTIIHKTETLKIKRPLGLIEFGTRAERDSLQHLHWNELLHSPNHAVARWHNFITFQELEQRRIDEAKAEQKRLQELADDEVVQ